MSDAVQAEVRRFSSAALNAPESAPFRLSYLKGELRKRVPPGTTLDVFTEQVKNAMVAANPQLRYSSKRMIFTLRRPDDEATSPAATTTAPATSDSPNVTFLEDLPALVNALQQDTALDPSATSSIAVSCKGEPSALHLVCLASPTDAYVIDCVAVGADKVLDTLRPVLESPTITKVFFDLHQDVLAIHEVAPDLHLRRAFDMQLHMELVTRTHDMGFLPCLASLGGVSNPVYTMVKSRVHQKPIAYAQRPLPAQFVGYAAFDVFLLLDRYSRHAEKSSTWGLVQTASDARVVSAIELNGQRKLAFDRANNYAMASYELIVSARPSDAVVLPEQVTRQEMEPLLSLLPRDLVGPLESMTNTLSDIVLDKGRRPWAWSDGARVMLDDNPAREVTTEDLECIVAKIGGFGTDNRAGLEKQLHRISGIRNRNQDIVGLTMRVGRHVQGLSALLLDVLISTDANVLFLGEPGCGKTTIVRDVARVVSQTRNVCIVDTSNEIAGDGDVPHPCVGLARRIMVPSLNAQSAVMVEVVQNHTPQVMLIDEIGRASEVEAARTCKQRGVRIIASAHGSMRKLIKNKPLRGLIGGVENVTVGDEEARKMGGAGRLQKTMAQRGGEPVFDVIVELQKGQYNSWVVVTEVAKAVDDILEGNKYKAHVRSRVGSGLSCHSVSL